MGMPGGWLFRWVLGGAVSNADDWSAGFWAIGDEPGPDDADFSTLTAGVLGSFQDKVWNATTTGLLTLNAPSTKLAQCNGYAYHNGVLTLEAVATQSPVAGTRTTAHPAYVAAVCTLRTAAFGRSARGRMYLPATGQVIDQTTLQSQSAQATATQMGEFLTDVRAAFGLGLTYTGATSPCVVSRVGAGAARPVTEVAVDSIPDTQRGRQSKAVATTVGTAPVTP